MASGDDYVQVTATLRRVTGKAVLLEVGDSVPRQAWVPRSCIHGRDDSMLDGIRLDNEITLRVFEWKAEAEDLI